MVCDCFERFKRHDFEACGPEHQFIMDKMKEAMETAIRQVMVKKLTELARGMIDDELILSEDVIA